ncbi:MAG: hypothetical protein OXE86_04015 [Alphaproteobacteria bacterium]|nr:hypothetical protein [Alphaproteobacteria bacterium]
MKTRMHWVLMAALFVSLALPLAACGKRGDPKPANPAAATHPRSYPSN